MFFQVNPIQIDLFWPYTIITHFDPLSTPTLQPILPFLFLIAMLMYIFCLQIPIFEKGYEKDPAVVAKEAIQEATRNGSDVVLVDTAGRMQVLFIF